MTQAGAPPAPLGAPAGPADVSSGLIGHWSLDDGTDPTADDSGHGHVGDLVGDPTFTTTVPSPAGGYALAFDDDGDYIEVQGDENDFDLQELTVAFWIKTPGFTENYEGLVTKGDRSWRVHEDDGTGYVGFYANGVGGLRSTQFITDDIWHHFAATYYSSTMAIYIDGELDISAARIGIIPDTTYPVMIGNNGQHTTRYFNGLMDDVRIYNRALSADDILQLYVGTLYRCFAETTGDNVTDFASADASAVQAAINALAPASDTIKLAGTCAGVQGDGTYTQTAYVDRDLTLQGGYIYTNWMDDPDPTAYPTTLDAQGQGRVVRVPSGVTAALDGLTLTGGAASQGGGPSYGSGVHNAGRLLLVTSIITGNNNTGNWAGGIYNVGTAIISDTAFANNSGEGAALFNTKNGSMAIASSVIYNNGPVSNGAVQNRGVLTLTNSTISGNAGTGIDNYYNGGTVTATHTTIVSNTGYGIINRNLNSASVLNLAATVLAYNDAGDCRNEAVFNDLGYNLVQDNTCITATTSFDGDPLFDVLADNGGPTLTHLPYGFSPAIDAIPALSCTLATDQRGEPRPANDGCDVGALELAVSGGVAWGADSSIVAAPGDVVTHTFVLTNTGNVVDIYDLILSGHAWPTAVLSETGALEPGVRVTVPVVVRVPDDPRAPLVIIGSDAFTLTARSWADGTQATATGTTQATAAPGVALDGDQVGSGRVGEPVTYTVQVTNTGTFTDTIDLTPSGNAWPVTLSKKSLPLGAGEMDAAVIMVTVPSTATLGGSDVVTITAASGLDVVSDRATLTTTVEALTVYVPSVFKEWMGSLE
jgi:hypothetical protein